MRIFKKLKNKNKFQKGFTLIETFVAITVLLIAITGPLYLVTRGLSVAKMVKGRITAIYLAQEAVEYIRNIRDNNILNDDDWLTDIQGYVSSGKKFTIDSPEQEIKSCDSDCDFLLYNEGNFLYGYVDGIISRFKREIQITEIDKDKEIEIVVDVYWNEGPKIYQFTATEYLSNWQ
ncbi:MAG: prepilin-type N-terminal cleavage/methylation domain-containing protein [Patescibacteria group bacterium]